MMLYLFLINFAFGKITLQGKEMPFSAKVPFFSCNFPSKDRNKNPCVISLRADREILFEKSGEIKAGDMATFYIDEMSVADAEKIEEVKMRSDFLSSVLFQAPIKQMNLENKENLQEKGSNKFLLF